LPRSFIHAGRKLEARESAAPNKVTVRVYEGPRAVTNVVYEVSIQTAVDALSGRSGTLPVNLVDALIDTAINDIASGNVSLIP